MSSDAAAAVPAGTFGDWLADMRAVLRGQRDADVPCGDCVGCCVSKYVIPLRPADSRVLESIPDRYLMIERGENGIRYQMKFREDGTCPLFCQGKCSVYQHRPRTCRDYDCRVYAATGLVPDGDRPVIGERVAAWRFSYRTEDERRDARAVRRAAEFIRSSGTVLPAQLRLDSSAAVAVLAVKVYPVFRESCDGEMPEHTCARIMDALRLFDLRAADQGM